MAPKILKKAADVTDLASQAMSIQVQAQERVCVYHGEALRKQIGQEAYMENSPCQPAWANPSMPTN